MRSTLAGQPEFGLSGSMASRPPLRRVRASSTDTFGLNYAPNESLIFRPEVRWDAFDADQGVGPGPFGDGSRRQQIMAAVDAIVSF